MTEIRKDILKDVKKTDWRDNCPSMVERWSVILQNGFLCDIVFAVGEKEEKISCHKLVLAVASPTFAEMFKAISSPDEPILLPDVAPDIFRSFLKFIYTDEIETGMKSSWYHVTHLMHLAKTYDIPSIMSDCVEILKTLISVSNVVSIYQQARKLGQSKLELLCWNFMTKHFDDLLASEQFLDLTHENLCKLVESDEILVEKEYNIFRGLIRWATADCVKKGITPSEKNQTLVLNKAINLIRFPLMSSEEFSKYVIPSQLIDSTEALNTLVVLLKNNDNKAVTNCSVRNPKTILVTFYKVVTVKIDASKKELLTGVDNLWKAPAINPGVASVNETFPPKYNFSFGTTLNATSESRTIPTSKIDPFANKPLPIPDLNAKQCGREVKVPLSCDQKKPDEDKQSQNQWYSDRLRTSHPAQLIAVGFECSDKASQYEIVFKVEAISNTDCELGKVVNAVVFGGRVLDGNDGEDSKYIKPFEPIELLPSYEYRISYMYLKKGAQKPEGKFTGVQQASNNMWLKDEPTFITCIRASGYIIGVKIQLK